MLALASMVAKLSSNEGCSHLKDKYYMYKSESEAAGNNLRSNSENMRRRIRECINLLGKVSEGRYGADAIRQQLSSLSAPLGALTDIIAQNKEEYDHLSARSTQLRRTASVLDELPSFLTAEPQHRTRGVPGPAVKVWSEEAEKEMKHEAAQRWRKGEERRKAEHAEAIEAEAAAKKMEEARRVRDEQAKQKELRKTVERYRRQREQEKAEAEAQAAKEEEERARKEKAALERRRKELHRKLELSRPPDDGEEEEPQPRPKTAADREAEVRAVLERHRRNMESVARKRRTIEDIARRKAAPQRIAEEMAVREDAKVRARVESDPSRIRRPTTAQAFRMASMHAGEGFLDGTPEPAAVNTGFDPISAGRLGGLATPAWRKGL
ncbi:hypothetical protein J8273_3259 [Carpediemonas membranifera]|uniref:Uncharacterized protein n=1 Tax=Carpediemonas membranifera TaxID=201153 RepID=A0A8J6E9C3_9EUKA|nr:hypothetical protein J8273_3259 [Carpediemonas membranifera]|eukprot:KAG9393130.1 hypothetical protein J8273_3259 [Carpediemonas membranifera]